MANGSGIFEETVGVSSDWVEAASQAAVDEAQDNALTDHVTAPNPHPQYSSSVEVDAGDAAVRGEFAAADAAHASAANPHPQYVLAAMLNALAVAYEGNVANLPGNPVTVRAAIEELAAKPGTFFAQTDTEADATGKAAWLLRYNATEDGVESVDPATIIPQQPLKLEDNWDPATNTPDLTLPANQVPDPTTQAAYIATADHLTDPNGGAIDGKTGDWYWWNGTAWAHLPRVDVTAVTDLQAGDRADDTNRGTWTPKQVHDQIPVKRLDPTETGIQIGEYRISNAGQLVQARTINTGAENPDDGTMGAFNSWKFFRDMGPWGDVVDYNAADLALHNSTWFEKILDDPGAGEHRAIEPGSLAAVGIWKKFGEPESTGVPVLEGITLTIENNGLYGNASDIVFSDGQGVAMSSEDFIIVSDSFRPDVVGQSLLGANLFPPVGSGLTRVTKLVPVGSQQYRGISAIDILFRADWPTTALQSVELHYMSSESVLIEPGLGFQQAAQTIPLLVDGTPVDLVTPVGSGESVPTRRYTTADLAISDEDQIALFDEAGAYTLPAMSLNRRITFAKSIDGAVTLTAAGAEEFTSASGMSNDQTLTINEKLKMGTLIGKGDASTWGVYEGSVSAPASELVSAGWELIADGNGAWTADETVTLLDGRTWQDVKDDFEEIHVSLQENNFSFYRASSSHFTDDLALSGSQDIEIWTYSSGTTGYRFWISDPRLTDTTLTVANGGHGHRDFVMRGRRRVLAPAAPAQATSTITFNGGNAVEIIEGVAAQHAIVTVPAGQQVDTITAPSGLTVTATHPEAGGLLVISDEGTGAQDVAVTFAAVPADIELLMNSTGTLLHLDTHAFLNGWTRTNIINEFRFVEFWVGDMKRTGNNQRIDWPIARHPVDALAPNAAGDGVVYIMETGTQDAWITDADLFTTGLRFRSTGNDGVYVLKMWGIR